MSQTPRWRRYLRFIRPNVAADVDDEIAFHVTMRVERNIALGLTPEAARADAVARFGDVAAVRDALVAHDARRQATEGRKEYLVDFLQDLRFGLRGLRRAPGFAAAAIITLALGIGANAAIFSVVDAVVLRPLPYAQPDGLVSIGTGAVGELIALTARLRSFAQIGAWVEQTHPVDVGQESLRVEGAAVTTNLLSLLGVAPRLGRGFLVEEGRQGKNTVLLISDGFWREHFGARPDVVGSKILVEGVPFTVVGVMPHDFHFPHATTRYWQPAAIDPANLGYNWAVWDKKIIGRLAPGVTLARAQREVRETWPTLRPLNPLWDPGPAYRQDVAPTLLQDSVIGTSGQLLWTLFGCVLLVLLIGCVNVANLLLARATTRERELAVRAALGGGRGRLVRQLITESLLLAGGFDTTQLIAARITPPERSYRDSTRVNALYDALRERVAAAPGVTSVTVSDKLPIAVPVWGMALRVRGQYEDAKHNLPTIGHFQQVTPGYFRTMRIPIVRGRGFTDADRSGQPLVAIVSQSVAKRYWPNAEALGQQIAPPWDAPWMTVVGIVPDTKQDSLRDTSRTSVYAPWAQSTLRYTAEMWVAARTTGDPSSLASTIRRIVRDLDRTIAVSSVRTMDAVVDESMRKTRFTVLLVGGFAAAALLLGAIGIYGVMSYLVGQRTQEMGIRLALGASAGGVLGLVVGRAARLAALGAALGILAALVATRWLSGLLYGVSATDPVTFVIVPIGFLAIAVLASYVPAHRATRIDPVRALKAE